MKAVLQRAASASVTVAGQTVGAIGRGVLVLLGVERGDGAGDVEWMARKIAELRMFEDAAEAGSGDGKCKGGEKGKREKGETRGKDAAGKMNRSVEEIGGEVLVVSQFTLCADCRKGRRPGFDKACEPARAEELYEACVAALRGRGLRVETGKFAAMMDVSLVNAGPVTFLLESPKGKPEDET